jgi:prepilin-type N-terminal cleavage/methylation domain-containing protein
MNLVGGGNLMVRGSFKQGFTLIEVIVAVVIVGIAAAFVVPNVMVSIEQSNAQAAKNNLSAISAAQAKFNEDYSAYCISTGANPTGYTALCGDTTTDLNINLHLTSSTSDPFSYSCTGLPAPYQCTATDGTVTLVTSGAGVSCTVGGVDCPF